MTRWQMFTEAFEEWRQQRLQNRALIRASRLFELLRPQWYQALFDEPFLRRFEPSALLEMTARDLAIEWARQFSYADPRRRDREIEQVTEVAAHFKELLQAAMSDLE